MQIILLQLTNFRNYQILNIEPSAALNIIVGENAQGKSNLLESIYLLATTKSLRAAKDTDLIRHEMGRCKISAKVVRHVDIDLDMQLLISHSEKKCAIINSVKHSKMADAVGKVNAVLFDSSALEIVRGEPSARRKFLDLEISQTSPRYVHALAAYRKTLEQRNHLLKSIKERKAGMGAMETLAQWNSQLARFGSQLIDGRIRFLQRLSELAGEMNLLLSDRRDRLELKYRPSVSLSDSFDLESIEQSFLEHIGRIQYEETLRGSTLVGPQRDDMTILVNGEDGRFFGSQGQQRTITLSLKFAERQLIEELMGEPPILLLDDVLSDLDDIRSARLYDLISKSGSQTFLSCTSVRSFSGDILQSASVWKVTKGEAALTR